jgi:hypothetical protein
MRGSIAVRRKANFERNWGAFEAGIVCARAIKERRKTARKIAEAWRKIGNEINWPPTQSAAQTTKIALQRASGSGASERRSG